MKFSLKKNFLNGLVGDSLLNIIASFILTFATQIIVYPFLANYYTTQDYGLILTVMGIVNSIGVSIGNSLNNTRLLMDRYYTESNVSGDYNTIFFGSSLLGSLIFLLIVSNSFKVSIIELLLSLILILLISFRSYYSVDYRLVINYKKILISNICGAIGYGIGILLFYISPNWLAIFVVGELFSCIYIYVTANIIKEPFKLTSLIRQSINKYFYILIASILSSSMLYMDRFIIFPIMGSEVVSIYTVASFLGKSAGILMNPIAGVLLTYYAKEDKISKLNFLRRTLIYGIVTLLIYLGIILVSDLITMILYPTIFEQAKPFLKIANLASIVLIYGNIIQPSLLRHSHSRWQMINQIVYLLVYLVSTYFGIQMGGLLGFCYGILFANIFRVLMMITIVLLSIDSNKNQVV